jgi:hypothetical protein
MGWLRSARTQHTRKSRSRRRDTQVRYIIAQLQNSSELGRQLKCKQQSAGSGSRRELRPCVGRQHLLCLKLSCTKHAPAVGMGASAIYHQILRIRCTLCSPAGRLAQRRANVTVGRREIDHPIRKSDSLKRRGPNRRLCYRNRKRAHRGNKSRHPV